MIADTVPTFRILFRTNYFLQFSRKKVLCQFKMFIFKAKKEIFPIVCCVFLASICVATSASTRQNCEKLPLKVLKRLHGPAFDPRYMSISEPKNVEYNDKLDDTDANRNKRGDQRPAFYITEEHTISLSDQPAWNVEWDAIEPAKSRQKRSPIPIGVNAADLQEIPDVDQVAGSLRKKRQLSDSGLFKEMKCEKRVKWIHLGPDYHPSHLRTIECTKPTCFYSHAKCKPRHFAVRILQRRRGACADASSLKTDGFSGKRAEVWEWIEVTVNFCCDCVAPNNFYSNNS